MDGCFFETISSTTAPLNHFQDGRYPAEGKDPGKYLLAVMRQGKNSVVQRFTQTIEILAIWIRVPKIGVRSGLSPAIVRSW
jgi:hypothetical protein